MRTTAWGGRHDLVFSDDMNMAARPSLLSRPLRAERHEGPRDDIGFYAAVMPQNNVERPSCFRGSEHSLSFSTRCTCPCGCDAFDRLVAGSAAYATARLKTIQEIITLLVFAAFSVLFLKEPITWNYAVGVTLLAAGSSFAGHGDASGKGGCHFIHTRREFND